jgi:succinyl-CoA synthetase beta subunit
MTGYPLDGALGTLMNSTGLSVVTAMLIAVLSGDPEVAAGIRTTSVILGLLPPVTPS